MSTNFVSVDRNQSLLLPPDLKDWVPEDDLVHFVVAAVEGLDGSVFRVNARGTGSAQYPPHMMLALLIYCYANGIFSSRRIERATYRDIGVRYLTGDTHPDHDTIAKFRRENFDAVAACFVHVLELAQASAAAGFTGWRGTGCCGTTGCCCGTTGWIGAGTGVRTAPVGGVCGTASRLTTAALG